MPEAVRLRLEDRIATGGDAIARLADGRIVFVTGALPGEEAEVELGEVRADYARGAAVRILEPSPARVDAPCPHHHAGCGGCPWQDVALEAQASYKSRIVVEALARIGGATPEVVTASVPGPAVGYRTTLHLASALDGRPGFRRRRSHDVVPVDSCLVAHPRLASLLPDLRIGPTRRVTLRTGTADGARLAVVDRVGSSRRPVLAGLPPDVAVLGPGQSAAVHEQVGGRPWRVSARSFFQSGPAAAEGIVDAVSAAVGDRLGPGARLVDLYAGVGVIGGVLAARSGATLIAVESDAGAVADAVVNLADLDATVVAAEVGRFAGDVADVVVADPARPGLGRPGVATVLRLDAPVVVLVSCDPASAARDTRLLGRSGYRLTSLHLVEAFPHTTHTETVCTYQKTSSRGL